MNLDFTYLSQALGIGFGMGVLSGSLGIGGGVLSTPALRMLMDCTPHIAVGTTLALISPTAVAGAINYLRKDLIDVRLAVRCSVTQVIGTVLGSTATVYVHGAVLMILVATMMAVVGVGNLTGFVERFREEKPDGHDFRQDEGYEIKAGLVGLVVGFMSGFLGIGGGFLLVPAFIYFFHMPIKTAFGTSLLAVAAGVIPGAIVHYLHGHVDLALAAVMLVGALPGAWLGSKAAIKLKDSLLKRVFGAALAAFAVFFFIRELHELTGG